MIDQFCPNPVVLQQVSTAPLRMHIDAVGQQLSQQGYTSSTAKYTMRLLADLSSWLQRHALTAADCNERLTGDFLHDRYRCRRPHRNDRAALRRLLKHMRDQGVIPIPVVETDTHACDPLVRDFQDYLLQQRRLAPTTVADYLDTVQRFLRERLARNRSTSRRYVPKTSAALWYSKRVAIAPVTPTTFQSFQFSDIETAVFMMVFRSGPPSYERMDSSSDRHHSLCLSRYHK